MFIFIIAFVTLSAVIVIKLCQCIGTISEYADNGDDSIKIGQYLSQKILEIVVLMLACQGVIHLSDLMYNGIKIIPQ